MPPTNVRVSVKPSATALPVSAHVYSVSVSSTVIVLNVTCGYLLSRFIDALLIAVTCPYVSTVTAKSCRTLPFELSTAMLTADDVSVWAIVADDPSPGV